MFLFLASKDWTKQTSVDLKVSSFEALVNLRKVEFPSLDGFAARILDVEQAKRALDRTGEAIDALAQKSKKNVVKTGSVISVDLVSIAPSTRESVACLEEVATRSFSGGLFRKSNRSSPNYEDFGG